MSVQTPTENWNVVAVKSSGSRRVVELKAGKNLFVGSSQNCGLQLSGDEISGLQCLLMLDESGVSVQDWASKSGTQVNGVAINAKTELSCGDKVSIGDYTIIVEPASASGKTSAVNSASGSSSASNPTESQRPDQQPAPTTPRSTPQTISPTLTRSPAPESSRPSEEDSAATDLDGLCASIRERTTEASTCDAASVPAANGSIEENPAEFLAVEATIPASDTKADVTESLSVEATSAVHADAGTEDREALMQPCTAPSQDAPAYDPFEFQDDLFDSESFDQETVQLLRAEIEDLQAALVQRDAQIESLQSGDNEALTFEAPEDVEQESEALLQRLQDLLDEAECQDERVALLEELLQKAEEANQAEQEERAQLEAWVGDIERRIGERESEWHAEVETLREQLEKTIGERDRVQHQLRNAATQGSAPAAYQETLDRLQEQNKSLQDELERTRKETVALQQQVERGNNQGEESLREERAAIARERAEVSRLRFELQQKVADSEKVPAAKDQADREFAGRLKTLREHLKEIHEEERIEREQRGDSTLSNRISRLWKRLES